MIENYRQQKLDFLDSVEPNDLRNGESFNQLGEIIDSLNEGFHQHQITNKNPEEFIKKAMANLFRENSPAINKAINLTKIYLEIK